MNEKIKTLLKKFETRAKGLGLAAGFGDDLADNFVSDFEAARDALAKEIEQLEFERDTFHAALEQYADEKNWHYIGPTFFSRWVGPDNGQTIAIRALEKRK